MALEPARNGLLARVGDYAPLRAFSQGGRYWDRVPQQLIRDSGLGEFLPPAEVAEDDRGAYARFYLEKNGRELLSKSKPIDAGRVPSDQLARLQQAIAGFKQKAADPATQPQNRELIEQFQLPDPSHDPELYRLAGPWWDRRLQVLWGCERVRDSSLPAAAAVGKLEPDRFYNWRRFLTALLLLLLILLPLWWLSGHWGEIRDRWAARTNAPPVVTLSTNRPPDLGPKNAASQPVVSDRQPTAGPGKTLVDPERAEADARKAQAAAEKARAAANHAQKDAASSQADADRKKQKAADALAAADKAEADARRARELADQAKADALARCHIVLSEQGQPGTDGTMEVTLEVRNEANPPRVIPVEEWQFGGQTVKAQRLQTRMTGGDHAVKAIFLDNSGKRTELSAVVTVEPGKVIATGGKVTVRQNEP